MGERWERFGDGDVGVFIGDGEIGEAGNGVIWGKLGEGGMV